MGGFTVSKLTKKGSPNMKQAFKIYIAVMVGVLVGLSLGDWLELLLTK